jgi:hypothetical protein
MPHERIYSLDSDPDQLNNAQVAWGHPSSPSNTGPGHGNDEGHVMVIVERPGTPARDACSVEEVERQVAARVEVYLAANSLTATTSRDQFDALCRAIIGSIGPDLVYAFGSPMELLAVTIDRKGCNKMISALRRGRDAAFGKDE